MVGIERALFLQAVPARGASKPATIKKKTGTVSTGTRSGGVGYRKYEGGECQ